MVLRIRSLFPIKSTELNNQDGRQPGNSLTTCPHGISTQNFRTLFKFAFQRQLDTFGDVTDIHFGRVSIGTALNVANKLSLQIETLDRRFRHFRGRLELIACKRLLHFEAENRIYQVVSSLELIRRDFRTQPSLNRVCSRSLRRSNREEPTIKFLGILLHRLTLWSGLGKLRKSGTRGLYKLHRRDSFSCPVQRGKRIAQCSKKHGIGLAGQTVAACTTRRRRVTRKSLAQRLDRSQTLHNTVEIAGVSEVSETTRFLNFCDLFWRQVFQKYSLDLRCSEFGGRSH
mmetsp:Transcript_25864/g.37877  ORF Transcript_25864/g.37877 Transcript_25864/m.37877 type:complete len:286 (-) Transcript_25864:283-1140(-)